jgi:N-acetylmuramoyl-L-alanine amidase
VFVVRAQRKVFQRWKQKTLWAKSGKATIANHGDIAKDAGMIPAEAAPPSPPDQPAVNAQTTVPGDGSRLVVLDPGHGAEEVGSVYRFSDGVVLQEKNLNLDIALRVAALLKDAGYRVVLTRDSDSGVNTQDLDLNGDDEVNVRDDLQARVDIANREEANVLVSIHCNGFDYSYLRGTEVYYDEDRSFSANNERLAEIVQRSLVSSIRDAGYETADRGIKTDVSVLQGEHFYLLGPAVEGIARPSQMPAVIGESLFLTNPGDAAQLRSDVMIEAIVRGYAAAISHYLATDR